MICIGQYIDQTTVVYFAVKHVREQHVQKYLNTEQLDRGIQKFRNGQIKLTFKVYNAF